MRTASLAPGLALVILASACPGPEEPPGPPVWYVDDIGDGRTGSGTADDPYRDLQYAIDAAADGDTLALAEGTFAAAPTDAVDPTCGNCDDATFRTDIDVTVGFRVEGKAVHLVGASRGNTVLETGAGYGLLFEDAGSSSVENLTITGGVRDADPLATDAAIVVRRTTLRVHRVDLRDNDDLYDGEPDPVVGVMGIAGREGAVLTVTASRVINSSWDGITLYRSDPDDPGSEPSATLVGNVVGCDFLCVSQGGRGVGVATTWDSSAVVVNNEIHDYWKGLGAFGESRIVATNNVVRDQVGWGVIADGTAELIAVNNVIADNGTTGLAAWSSTSRGDFTNNLVTGNGWSADEWVGKRTGVWMNAPDSFTFAFNDVWGNQTEDVCSGGFPGGADCTPLDFDGVDGNFSADPLVDPETWAPEAGSPLIDAGDPAIDDADGTRSDVGVHGGPDAGRTDP